MQWYSYMRVNIRANFRIDWTFRGKDLKEGGGGGPSQSLNLLSKSPVRIQLNKSYTAKLQVKTIDQGITLLDCLSSHIQVKLFIDHKSFALFFSGMWVNIMRS